MPAWLLTMQDDDGWRRTLIELAREHRQSALLRFVLKQLSDNGYHREIAAVISETDLFSVFNGEEDGEGGRGGEREGGRQKRRGREAKREGGLQTRERAREQDRERGERSRGDAAPHVPVVLALVVVLACLGLDSSYAYLVPFDACFSLLSPHLTTIHHASYRLQQRSPLLVFLLLPLLLPSRKTKVSTLCCRALLLQYPDGHSRSPSFVFCAYTRFLKKRGAEGRSRENTCGQ